jgi:hypothetical protein
MSKPPVLTNRV